MIQTGNNISYEISQLEHMPLNLLLTLSEQKTAGAVKYCSNLSFYREKWLKCGLQRFDNFKLKHLKQLPLITRKDLTEGSRNLYLKNGGLPHVQLWNNADGVDPIIWLPRGIDDVADYTNHATRITNLLELTENDCLLILNQPSIGSANMLPYVIAKALKTKGIACQVITVDMGLIEHVSKWIDFLYQNQPTVMIAQGNDAIKLSNILKERNAQRETTREHFQQGKRSLIPALKTILLYGSDCSTHKMPVESAYGANVRISVGLLDLRIGAMECSARQGIHMWLDNGVYEIIPEVNNKVTGCGSVECHWIWEAEAGMKGELVITNFNGVLPIIRYRSGYQIEITGNGICGCGRTHPRIKLL